MILLKFSFWLFLVLLVLGLAMNLVAFVPFLVVVGLLLVGYSFLPEEVKKITKIILNSLKQSVFGVKKEN